MESDLKENLIVPVPSDEKLTLSQSDEIPQITPLEYLQNTLNELEKDDFVLKGHEGHVLCFAMNSSGSHLASGSEDKLIKLWSIKGKREETTFSGHTAAVKCRAFSPTDAYLASDSGDNTIKS